MVRWGPSSSHQESEKGQSEESIALGEESEEEVLDSKTGIFW